MDSRTEQRTLKNSFPDVVVASTDGVISSADGGTPFSSSSLKEIRSFIDESLEAHENNDNSNSINEDDIAIVFKEFKVNKVITKGPSPSARPKKAIMG